MNGTPLKALGEPDCTCEPTQLLEGMIQWHFPWCARVEWNRANPDAWRAGREAAAGQPKEGE